MTAVIAAFASAAMEVGVPASAATTAPQSSSSQYQLNEVFFGSGGSLQDCSANYCAKTAAGEGAVGNTRSANYQAEAGFNTDRKPYIELNIINPNVDLGLLRSDSTKTANASFWVRTYQASGYSVKQYALGPTNGIHTLNRLSTPTASQVGTEQFGVNYVANTDPVTFGADPVQRPDASFSFGQVANGYNTANQYKYVNGDTVAYSTQNSGRTDYTVSYIFNVSNLTPGGAYLLAHVLVATATF